MGTDNGGKGHTNKRAIATNQGERGIRSRRWKARQLPGNDDVGAKTKEPGSLKRASRREPVCATLRSAMV